jgi:hypothetical protein
LVKITALAVRPQRRVLDRLAEQHPWQIRSERPI